MSYDLSWSLPEHTISLTLSGSLSTEELHIINQRIIDILDDQLEQMVILMNAEKLVANYQTANQLRDSQKYMNHPNLNAAFIIVENKLNRLIILMAFGMSRLKLVLFHNIEQAELALKRAGYHSTESC